MLQEGEGVKQGQTGRMGYALHRLRVAIFLKALLSVFSVVVSVSLSVFAVFLLAVANVLLLTFWRIKLAALDNNLYLICDKSMQNSESFA